MLFAVAYAGFAIGKVARSAQRTRLQLRGPERSEGLVSCKRLLGGSERVFGLVDRERSSTEWVKVTVWVNATIERAASERNPVARSAAEMTGEGKLNSWRDAPVKCDRGQPSGGRPNVTRPAGRPTAGES